MLRDISLYGIITTRHLEISGYLPKSRGGRVAETPILEMHPDNDTGE